MKKWIAIIFLLSLFFKIPYVSADANWIYIGNTEESEIYVDLNSIEYLANSNETIIGAWSLDLHFDEREEPTASYYLFNIQTNKKRLEKMIFFDREFNVKDEMNFKDQKWWNVHKDSILDYEFRLIKEYVGSHLGFKTKL